MRIEVIPQQSWSSFFANITRFQKTLNCSIHFQDGPSEVIAGDDLLFYDISFTDDSEQEVNIIAGDNGKEINHVIKNIKQICVTKKGNENESSILIKSAGNFITSLNFPREA